MELYEHLVMWFLTTSGDVFLAPQYSIAGDDGREWSCPDFVALDFHEKIVWVVEVSTSYDHVTLRAKIAAREKQWNERLRGQLERLGVAAGWKTRVLAFVRNDAATKLSALFAQNVDVTVACLDSLGAPWTWTDRRLSLSERVKSLNQVARRP